MYVESSRPNNPLEGPFVLEVAVKDGAEHPAAMAIYARTAISITIYVYTLWEIPPLDNSGRIMQINSPPWLRGQAQWGPE